MDLKNHESGKLIHVHGLTHGVLELKNTKFGKLIHIHGLSHGVLELKNPNPENPFTYMAPAMACLAPSDPK